ncbi:hypothetical protein [Kribbella sp. NPDC006257]|uniref:hypothetical protein n=1 Tax=Kribbella sp. NPDC006257 TaxID=3156738 RepID=UPI0033A7BD8A
MPTATIDDFDLDIRLEAIDPHRVSAPKMGTSNPHSEPCCSDWTCPIDCKPTVDC